LATHSLQTLEGEKADLGRLEGSVVVLNFWAEWCKPCRKELPVLDEWYRELSGRGVKFVAVSIGREARKARRMARSLDLEMPLYHDGPDGLAATIDLPHLPITYVIDGRGQTIAVANGSKESELARLRSAIESALPAAGSASMNSLSGGER
jgi:thiol-disulfide isomerase/thioredoxin